MPRRPANLIDFPRYQPDRFLLSEADHRFLVTIIGPCHGPHVEDLLVSAQPTNRGMAIDLDHPHLGDLFDAIGIEIMGFMELEDESAGGPRLTPKRGGTAAKLQKIYDLLEAHLG